MPENYSNKAIEFVKKMHPDRLVLDHGQHCVCCDETENLISNPDMPRVICLECYTWAVMEVSDKAEKDSEGGNK